MRGRGFRQRLIAVVSGGAMLALLSGHAQAQGEATRVHRFGNWMVGCDNKAECAVIGTSRAEHPGASVVALRIATDDSSLSGYRFEVIVTQEGVGVNRPIILTCPLCGNGVSPPGVDKPYEFEIAGTRISLPDIPSSLWLAALGQGRMIAANSKDGASSVFIDSSQFKDAWIHLARTRGDIMRGMAIEKVLPSLRNPAPKQVPKRVPEAQEVIPSGYPGIERLTKKCPDGHNVETYRQFRLPGGAELWSVSCRNAEGRSMHWYQSRGPADLPAPLELPDADRGHIKAGKVGLRESVFDFDFGILRAWNKPFDGEDCGVQHAWGWDGSAWFLLERREMPVCTGLSPPDWIRTYAAP